MSKNLKIFDASMKETMNVAYLLIGGNMGDRKTILQNACAAINIACGGVIKKSSLYETAAWGSVHQPAFLNQALVIQTNNSAENLLTCLLGVEENLGRVRTEKYGPRTIDIDILFFNDVHIQLPHLQIPHPQIAARRFVLEPLAEIAPSLMHPVLQQTIRQLLKNCTDSLPVHKI